MKIKSVKVKNFRGFGENPSTDDRMYHFDNLDSNLTLISGNNGYGKTSFFEAIEWALTDNIARVKKFNDVYHANTLQNKNTLKFISPNSNCDINRQVVVIIVFSDGVEICRKSNKDFIQITDRSDYNSTVTYKYKGNEITKEEFAKFKYPAFETDSFLKNHFLMQEDVSAFFKTTKPEHRREQIMELLDIDHLNKLYKVTNKLIQSNKFSNKENSLKKKIDSLKKDKKELKNTIQQAGFDSVEDYVLKFTSYLRKLNTVEVEEEKNLDELLKNISEKMESKKINFKMVYDLADNIKINANQKEQKIKNDIALQKALSDSIQEYRKYNKFKRLLEKDISIKKLQEINVTESRMNLKRKTFQLTRLNKMEEHLEQEWEQKQLDIPEITIIPEGFKEKLDMINLIDEKISSYNEKYTNDKLPKKELDSIKDIDLKSEYKSITNQIKHAVEKREILDNQYKENAKLNKDHEALLNKATNYIQKNEVKECPICLSTDFSHFKDEDDSINKSDNYNSLLSIISRIKSNGEEKVNKLISKIQDLNKNILDLKSEKSKLEEKCKQVLLVIKEEVGNLLLANEKRFKSKNDRLNQISKRIKEEMERISNEIKNYKSIKEKLQIKEVDNLEKTIELNQIELNKLAKRLDVSRDSTISDIESILREKRYTINERYKVEIALSETKSMLEEIEETMKEQNVILDKCEKISSSLKKLEEYSLTNRQFNALENYNSILNDIRFLEEQLELVDEYKQKIVRYRKEINKKRKDYINYFVNNQPIISWIFSMISPHKFYKDLKIITGDKNLNVTDEKERIYLDHIFSSAQLNILSLSIFLGMGLMFRENKLNNLFIDDPIQSLDDVNVLTLIDIFRALPKSDYKDIKLIISSHDDKFTQLLAIKMRNHNFTHYKFTDYTEEGPVVKMLKN